LINDSSRKILKESEIEVNSLKILNISNFKKSSKIEETGNINESLN